MLSPKSSSLSLTLNTRTGGTNKARSERRCVELRKRRDGRLKGWPGSKRWIPGPRLSLSTEGHLSHNNDPGASGRCPGLFLPTRTFKDRNSVCVCMDVYKTTTAPGSRLEGGD